FINNENLATSLQDYCPKLVSNTSITIPNNIKSKKIIKRLSIMSFQYHVDYNGLIELYSTFPINDHEIINLVNLIKFTCLSANRLTNISIDKLTKLKYLYCFNRKFSLSNLTGLKFLACDKIEDKDIKYLYNLEYLVCYKYYACNANLLNLKFFQVIFDIPN